MIMSTECSLGPGVWVKASTVPRSPVLLITASRNTLPEKATLAIVQNSCWIYPCIVCMVYAQDCIYWLLIIASHILDHACFRLKQRKLFARTSSLPVALCLAIRTLWRNQQPAAPDASAGPNLSAQGANARQVR